MVLETSSRRLLPPRWRKHVWDHWGGAAWEPSWQPTRETTFGLGKLRKATLGDGFQSFFFGVGKLWEAALGDGFERFC